MMSSTTEYSLNWVAATTSASSAMMPSRIVVAMPRPSAGVGGGWYGAAATIGGGWNGAGWPGW
jgi:hypothetical protein